MKHLKKFNESVEDEKRDILDNFEFISDKFGEPDCYSSNTETHQSGLYHGI